MANADTPFGLKPVGHISGGPYNPTITWCMQLVGDSVAIGRGDPVTIVDAHGLTDANYPVVEQVDAGDRIFGVAIAFRLDDPEKNASLVGSDTIPRLEYGVASTFKYVGVLADPGNIYEVQEDSDGVNLAAANIMSCADVVVAAANTTTGLSQVELDSSSVTAADSAAGGAQLQILRLSNLTSPNAVGTNAKWLVRIAENDLSATSGV